MPNTSSSSTKRSSSSNAAHLARVRENQRRSRARRKEYLNELEENFRRCKERGVEASAEMQQAARRVLEENQRLRLALKAQGMTDEQIENLAADRSPSGSPGGRSSPAAAELDNLLSRQQSRDPDAEDLSPRRSFDRQDSRYGSAHESGYGRPSASERQSVSESSDSGQGFRRTSLPSPQRSVADDVQFAIPAGQVPGQTALPPFQPPYAAYGAQNPGFSPPGPLSNAPDLGSRTGSYGYGLTTSPTTSRRSTTSNLSAHISGEDPRYLSANAETYPPAASHREMDMSELLSPELQAQFTAALQGNTYGDVEGQLPWEFQQQQRRWQ